MDQESLCKDCGAQIEYTGLGCEICGKANNSFLPLKEVCSSCGTRIEPGDLSCSVCAERQVRAEFLHQYAANKDGRSLRRSYKFVQLLLFIFAFAVATSVLVYLSFASGISDGSATNSQSFSDCDDLRATFPGGVGRPDAIEKSSFLEINWRRDANLYSFNISLDEDQDGVSCEVEVTDYELLSCQAKEVYNSKAIQLLSVFKNWFTKEYLKIPVTFGSTIIWDKRNEVSQEYSKLLELSESGGNLTWLDFRGSVKELLSELENLALLLARGSTIQEQELALNEYLQSEAKLLNSMKLAEGANSLFPTCQ